MALELLRGRDVGCGTVCLEARGRSPLEGGRGADTRQVIANKGSMRCDKEEHRDILARATATHGGRGQAINDACVETSGGSMRRGRS